MGTFTHVTTITKTAEYEILAESYDDVGGFTLIYARNIETDERKFFERRFLCQFTEVATDEIDPTTVNLLESLESNLKGK